MAYFSSINGPASTGTWVRIMGILFLTVLAAGCGDRRDDGIEAVVAAGFTGANVGNGGIYTDQFITPATVTVGIKSLQLILAGETSPSYTIFDTENIAAPIVLDLDEIGQRAGINSTFPTDCPCSYAKALLELTFFEIDVPVYESAASFINRQIRFYTLDSPDPSLPADVLAGDVLVGDGSALPGFSWIDLINGSYEPLTGTRPLNPLQVPESLFQNLTYSSTVSADMLPFLEIPEKPKGTITITITIQAGNLFFYDETDSPENNQFDRFTDGRLNANEPDSRFYPTFPGITAVP